jgi:hypothetical protein
MFGAAATGDRIERRAVRRLSIWTRDYLREVALADRGCAVVGLFIAAQPRFGNDVTAACLALPGTLDRRPVAGHAHDGAGRGDLAASSRVGPVHIPHGKQGRPWVLDVHVPDHGRGCRATQGASAARQRLPRCPVQAGHESPSDPGGKAPARLIRRRTTAGQRPAGAALGEIGAARPAGLVQTISVLVKGREHIRGISGVLPRAGTRSAVRS